jgi:hypothetical protein
MAIHRNPWLHLSIETMRLGIEAQNVIGLRMSKVARGGILARDETQLMIAEKSKAAWDANVILTRSLLTGEGHLAPGRTLALYRRRVRANQRRLSRGE